MNSGPRWLIIQRPTLGGKTEVAYAEMTFILNKEYFQILWRYEILA